MKGLLKFITCGSVDDGKSTLIGHLLYDAKLLFADVEDALVMDSKVGSRAGEIDYSLLLDGLVAEREQGITIDVAYRYFTTENRSFIVADTPGHEEYTRNMAVGASFADLAVILVDASQGILIQTKRHARICALMGIRHFVFAVNKMDLVKYDKARFDAIRSDISDLASELSLHDVKVIPVSATEGDNVTKRSYNMSWYKGPVLLKYLEEVDIDDADAEAGFTLPVQRVCRPDHTFRGFAGQIESGRVRVGDEVTVLPSKEQAKVTRILNTDKDVDEASVGEPVTVCLDREVDVSRGCVIVTDANVHIASMLSATILWTDDAPLVEGKSYLIKLGTQKLPATILKISYKVDVNSGEHIAADRLSKNEIARCDIALGKEAVFDTFKKHRALGEFILIDRVTNMTSACGVVEHHLRRGENLTWQELDVTRELRSNKLEQKPKTLWFTGLSGAGKSTLANAVEKALFMKGRHTMTLDGDNIRMGINKNLGFDEEDRIENIRRISEVAKLINDAGIIVLTAFISPYRSDRRRAREVIGSEDFIEIYVSTPIEECERRDIKGLYKKARSGEIPNFTGIGSPYEAPEHPEIEVDTSKMSIEEATDFVLKELEKYL